MSGHRLVLVLGTSGGMNKRVAEGEKGDVIVSTSRGLEDLARRGQVVGDTIVPIARSQVGLAVLKGAPRPDISTPEALRRTLLEAKAVAYSDPRPGAPAAFTSPGCSSASASRSR